MTLRLADLEAPLEDVEFPDGSHHQPRPFGPAEYKAWREIEQGVDRQRQADLLETIVRACYPTATDEHFITCTPRMMIALIAHAGRKIEQVKDALKNADAVAAAAPPLPQADTSPSSPKPSGSTSASRSRKRSAKNRGESTPASHTDDPSLSGSGTTTSKNPDASTPYAVKWTTSTARPSPASA